MARDDDQVLTTVKHKGHEDWGTGKVYDVMPQVDMALVAFEEVDVEKHGFDPVFRKWYPLSHLCKPD